MATKAELQARIADLEAAFDSLMASHMDFTGAKSMKSVDRDWAIWIEERAANVRHSRPQKDHRDDPQAARIRPAIPQNPQT